MKKVITINCELPGGFGEYTSFNSKASLMDADFVVLCPETSLFSGESHLGKPFFSDKKAFQLRESMDHWRREVGDLLKAGKTVFVLLANYKEFYVDTGERTYSGTGRNRAATRHVALLSNYSLLPVHSKLIQSEGKEMVLSQGENPLKEYWNSYGNDSKYSVYIETGDTWIPLVTTRTGSRLVGGIAKYSGGGALVALPWIDFYREDFLALGDEDEDGEVESTWTSDATGWGMEYLQTLSSIDDAAKRKAAVAHIPQWAMDQAFSTRKETELTNEIADIEEQIKQRHKEREDATARLKDAAILRRLLFDQGHSLEEAVLHAMRRLGFEANPFRDAQSEFDCVLESPEGRLIGEVEGRDVKPISIRKMRQLEVNVLEDFERDDVSEIATGVLFGNAYRLARPSERSSEHFTTKCKQAATRNGTVLVRTCDLFQVARALADEPDAEFAEECRRAIFSSTGDEVQFPTIGSPHEKPVDE